MFTQSDVHLFRFLYAEKMYFVEAHIKRQLCFYATTWKKHESHEFLAILRDIGAKNSVQKKIPRGSRTHDLIIQCPAYTDGLLGLFKHF